MQPPTTDCPTEPAGRLPSAPSWDVADILRLDGATDRRHHVLPPGQQQVRHDIAACRTAPLGGPAAHWPSGGFERYA